MNAFQKRFLDGSDGSSSSEEVFSDANLNETATDDEIVGLPADFMLDNNSTTNTNSNTDNVFNNNTTLGDNSGGGGGGMKDETIWSTTISIGWIVMSIYLCCCQRRQARREHWRGAEIRARFEAMQEEEQARKEKEAQTPLQRQEIVTHNIRTKRVISKDADGNWTLGKVQTADSPTKTNPFPLASLSNDEDDLDDEDHLCVICLDSFQVGDVVSWSRYSKECHHVYHAECVKPWLEDKKQDECPACRMKIILETPPGLSEGDESSEEEESPKKTTGEEEEDEEDRDNFFMIVHGMISRAAKKASYSLIGNKGSSDDETKGGHGLASPSPLRRVLSHGSVFRTRRSSLPTTPVTPVLGSSSSSSSARSLLRSNSYNNNRNINNASSGKSTVDAPTKGDDEFSIRANNSNDEEDVPQTPTKRRLTLMTSPFSFRKVKSDIVSPYNRTELPTLTIPEGAEPDIYQTDLPLPPRDPKIVDQTGQILRLEQTEGDGGEAQSILEMMGYGRSGHLAYENYSDVDEEDEEDEEDIILSTVATTESVPNDGDENDQVDETSAEDDDLEAQMASSLQEDDSM